MSKFVLHCNSLVNGVMQDSHLALDPSGDDTWVLNYRIRHINAPDDGLAIEYKKVRDRCANLNQPTKGANKSFVKVALCC